MNIESNLAKIGSTYPHIKKRIDILWGTVECRNYIESLLILDRPERKGFPAWASESIEAILDSHDSLFPQHQPQQETWSLNNGR